MNQVNRDPTIFVLDGDADFRDRLENQILQSGYPVESHARGADFMAGQGLQRPGCLISDLHLPDMDGPALQAELIRRGSTLPVIFMTAKDDIAKVVAAMKMGAVDCLMKPFEPQEMIGSIAQALQAEYRHEQLRREVRDVRQRHARLSAQECQVMDLVAAGLSSREVANRLGISVRTVEIHRSHLMKKMQAGNLVALTRMALRLNEAEKAPGFGQASAWVIEKLAG